jgi:hypothetical protein
LLYGTIIAACISEAYRAPVDHAGVTGTQTTEAAHAVGTADNGVFQARHGVAIRLSYPSSTQVRNSIRGDAQRYSLKS